MEEMRYSVPRSGLVCPHYITCYHPPDQAKVFTPTKAYTVRESTPDMHISYYVTPSHAAKYPLGSVEQE